MRLSSMRYKNYTWPHNPETFVVEYRRQIIDMMVCRKDPSCHGSLTSFPG